MPGSTRARCRPRPTGGRVICSTIANERCSSTQSRPHPIRPRCRTSARLDCTAISAIQRSSSRRPGWPWRTFAPGSMPDSVCAVRASPRRARSRRCFGLGLGRRVSATRPEGATGPEDAALEEWRDLLFGISYRMLGGANEAEDIVQEAYLRWSQRRADVVVPSVGSGQAPHVSRPVVARTDRGGTTFGGRAVRLLDPGLPGSPRRTHPARTSGLPLARHLRISVCRGRRIARSHRDELPSVGVAGPAPHRGTAAAIRCGRAAWP